MRFQSDSQRKAVMARMSRRQQIRRVAFRDKAEPYKGPTRGHPVLRGLGASLVGATVVRKFRDLAVGGKIRSQAQELVAGKLAGKQVGKQVGKLVGLAAVASAVGLGAGSAISRYLTRRDVQGKGRFKTPQEARSYRRTVAGGLLFFGLPGAAVGAWSARRANAHESVKRRKK